MRKKDKLQNHCLNTTSSVNKNYNKMQSRTLSRLTLICTCIKLYKIHEKYEVAIYKKIIFQCIMNYNFHNLFTTPYFLM